MATAFRRTDPVAQRQEAAHTDAALYITKLPKAEHDAEEWLAAMEALLLRWPNRAAGALSQAAQNPMVEWNEGAAFVMRHAAYGGVC